MHHEQHADAAATPAATCAAAMHAPAGVPGVLMVAAHVVAVVLTAALLARGERLVWALARLILPRLPAALAASGAGRPAPDRPPERVFPVPPSNGPPAASACAFA